MRLALICILTWLAAAAPASAPDSPAIFARWVQMAPGGVAEIRAVVGGPSCPALVLDGATTLMRERAAPDANFPVRVCALTLPKAAKRAVLLGQPLPLPKLDPAHLVVLGDTGCRIKGMTVQDCNDPAQWPFRTVAASAAAT